LAKGRPQKSTLEHKTLNFWLRHPSKETCDTVKIALKHLEYLVLKDPWASCDRLADIVKEAFWHAPGEWEDSLPFAVEEELMITVSHVPNGKLHLYL
jgi:hypothetical protein